ncbi:hypothetical protein DCS32_08635 [Dokdonia sp. Dokd-P16]|uniref:hypothetical protein n=1 Tax=Dokdonia sp. Dokd-P16 TaxID=2173169 RepID=UPI000D5445D1|nr:hypothetical protein [Dokdonia sp. Dokd-P16]AWH74226.1 hypothetical protein DCS32_08635 [Dokdonia sp. Dokd-P16]
MKYIGLVLLVLTLSCSSDDNQNELSVKGETYIAVSYKVESAIDINGDGIASIELFDESDRSMLGQGVYFREDNKVYPPNPLIVCIDATEDGDVVNYCAVIADYNPLPTYTQNKNAVTIDNGMEGEVSADFETIVFKEVFYKSRNNNDGTTTREQEVAMVTYQKQ